MSVCARYLFIYICFKSFEDGLSVESFYENILLLIAKLN